MSTHDPTTIYETQRDRVVERVVCYLLDCYEADPAAGSIPVQTIRSFLHQSSWQAWTGPVLAVLARRGLVQMVAGEDGRQMLYYTEAFRRLARGEPR